jgi:hypothetical protein
MEMESVLCVTTGKVDEVCWLAPIIFLMMEKTLNPFIHLQLPQQDQFLLRPLNGTKTWVVDKPSTLNPNNLALIYLMIENLKP